MNPLRSPGWTVRPSFVPHGATNDVTLLADDYSLTQLTGVPDVAWQTPWEVLSNLQLVRFSRGMALFATAAGVRYCWRTANLADFESWREVVTAHGGSVARRPRRAGVLVVVAVVLVASFAGGIVATFTHSSADASELAAARAVNLRLDDLPHGFSVTSGSYLTAIIGPAGRVYHPSRTTTTLAPAKSPWGRLSSLFQGCLGVSNAHDRVFGAAGQAPDVQVNSSIFRSSAYGGIDLASTTQYYKTTTMVRRDVAEMSEAKFGSCFAAVNAAFILDGISGTVPDVAPGATYRPVTYVKGWARGGEIVVPIKAVPATVHLVVVEVAGRHFEVTLTALVEGWPQSRAFLNATVNTLVGRVSSHGATAA